MSVEFLRRKIASAPVAFMYDSVGNQGFGMLRTLPAIKYLGTNRFTFPKRWRQLSTPAQYDYFEYDYELLGEIGPPDSNLCTITNQNYETHTEFTIKPILAKYEQSPDSSTLLVVGDEGDFEPQGGQRPLRENEFVSELGDYHSVFTQFEDTYEELGLGCPLADTENLFMQDNANIYRIVTGERLRQTGELFEVLPETPYLPLYAGMASIFSRTIDPGASPLDSYEAVEALGNWLRRRIEWDRQSSIAVARELNDAVASDERTFDSIQPQRHPDARLAREKLSECRNKSEVHARYAAWVTEITT